MKNNTKRIMATGLAGFIIGTTLTVSAATWIQAYRNDKMKILLNGETQIFRDATTNEIELPIMYNDRTYLPLRSLATLFGVNVDYDETTDTVILETQNNENRKLKPNRIGDFMAEVIDDKEGLHFEYGPNKELYGFEEDIFMGCSEWCSVGNWEYKATATSTLKSQSGISYDASNILNYERKNTWVEGVNGYGIGETIEISQKYEARGNENDIDFLNLCIVNGYAENIEKWTNNSRVKELKFFFNDKYVTNIELEDTINPQYINIEEFGLKTKFGEEAKFSFEIVDVYEGEKYDDTAITGIVVDFWTRNH